MMVPNRSHGGYRTGGLLGLGQDIWAGYGGRTEPEAVEEGTGKLRSNRTSNVFLLTSERPGKSGAMPLEIPGRH